MSRLADYLPILDWGRRYNRQTLASDLVAALIVTIMLIPQSLAYALLAGLPPEVGLYASILPLTKFGLMQITRQRVRPEMNIVTKEKCPTCNGTGSISASILVSDQIERNLDYIMEKQNETSVSISMHPYLYAYFTRGFISRRMKWFFKYHRWIKLEEDSSMGVTEFRFRNKLGEEMEVT